MKEYTFRLVIREGSDHFWNENPTPQEVSESVEEGLASVGYDCVGFGYEHARNELTLLKMELIEGR